MEVYIAIVGLSLFGLIGAVIWAVLQERRDQARWVRFYRDSGKFRAIKSPVGPVRSKPVRRPVTVVRIDPLELELLLEPPEEAWLAPGEEVAPTNPQPARHRPVPAGWHQAGL
ncbi:MAG: hypothetical protein KJ621_14995 [Proteobacteria bacterium]|nr:hypothetical protein [Pseudomonadota bacterium]MBU1741102.1 hypothetical protein [Pseudomonadota bacterium]